MIRILKCIPAVMLLAALVGESQGAPIASDSLKGTIVLSESRVLTTSQLTVEDGTVIITNGYPLQITVTGDLVIKGTWKILSEDPTENEPAKLPAAPKKAGNGNAFNPGPDTGGSGGGENGRGGGDGQPGLPGNEGVAGSDAGPVSIVVTGNASGNLAIVNNGGNGGPGGQGGEGGDGGAGEQGGRGVPNIVAFGIAAGASKGPGHGGNGGRGGNGGPGGKAGRGGNGGDVNIAVLNDSSKFKIVQFSDEAGSSGSAGEGGKGGQGGALGWGGRGDKGVEGRIKERKGEPGGPGDKGKRGDAGEPGKKGKDNLEGNPSFRTKE